MSKAEELKRIAEALVPPLGDASFITLYGEAGVLTQQGRILATWASDAVHSGSAPRTAAFARYADLCERHVMRPGAFFKAFPHDARALYVALLEDVQAEIDQLIGDKKPDPTRPIDVDKILRKVEARMNDDGIRPAGNLVSLVG